MEVLRMKPFLSASIICFIALWFCSCSSQQKDYDELQKLQEANEQTMQHTVDFDIKIKTCDDVITALQKYLSQHNNGEWVNTARTSLASWQSRKAEIESEKITLTDRLKKAIDDLAIKVSQNQHNMSHIETIDLTNNVITTEGTQMVMRNDYNVRMNNLFKLIFKFNVHIKGRANMATKNIAIDTSSVRVDE